MQKETVYKYQSTIPYSLHDMRVYKIEMTDEKIELYFENGFVELKEPYPQVEGNIVIEGADPDFCCVWLLSQYGQYGEFQGRKMALDDFIREYASFSFEIVDELYGYNQVNYAGYLTIPGDEILREMEISVYYTGNIIYITQEKK